MLIACPGSEPGFLLACAIALMLSPLSFGLLTAPACLAVSRLTLRRFAAPLQRGTFEECVVVSAALAGAGFAVLYAGGIGAAFGGPDAAIRGEALLVFVVPAPLGAIPWAAGELLSGESKRHCRALCCSIAVAYALSMAWFAIVGSQAFWVSPPAALVTRLGSAAIAGLGATEAYLMTRGAAVEPAPPEAIALERVLSDYSSSISEKRSLRGCSSGFF